MPDEPDRLYALIELTDQEASIKFMRAAVEIEESVEGTTAKIVNTADYVDGEPPPTNPGDWTMFGVISGPTAENVPENRRDAFLANWSGEITAILEAHGLKPEEETIN